MVLYFVPYLFAIHPFEDLGLTTHDENGAYIYPPLTNLSYGSLDPHGIYLMDDGQSLRLFLSKEASKQ